MIIWGFRSRGKALGQRMLNCPNCHRDAMTAAYQSRRWFTLFFIPVFPIGAKRTLARCGLCGYQYQVDNAQAEALFGAGAQPAPTS
jgi:transcription elongation factor Elf1